MPSIKSFLSNLYSKKAVNSTTSTPKDDPESLRVFNEKYWPRISEIIVSMQNDIKKLRVGKFSLDDVYSLHLDAPPSSSALVYYDAFTVAVFHWQGFEDEFDAPDDDADENPEFIKAWEDINTAIMKCMKKYSSKLRAIHPGLTVEMAAEDVDVFYIKFTHPNIKDGYLAPGLT